MNWYKHSMPLAENKGQYSTPFSIGHRSGKNLLWLIDSDYKMYSYMTNPTEVFNHSKLIKKNNLSALNLIAQGRYESATALEPSGLCSLIFYNKYKNQTAIKDRIVNMLDRAFGNPKIIQFDETPYWEVYREEDGIKTQ
jgi:hypothetical protein